MINKLNNYYQKFRESLFFVPAFISVIYAAICFLLVWLQIDIIKDTVDLSRIYNGNIADAKSLISALLSAMITMTSLVVSVTMVVINLSASQLGPRIIRSVLSDSKTKLYIGCFFGSITACFVISGFLHQLPEGSDVPSLGVAFVFVSCFLNLFVLLAYVHHLGHLSVADSLVSKVHGELMAKISRLKDYDRAGSENTQSPPKGIPKSFDKKAKTSYCGQYGYVQTIDYESIKKIAESNSICVEILCDAGDYIVSGAELFRAYPAPQADTDVEKSIEKAIILGEDRTGAQDIEYSMRHLVEVGLRALSPGINDNFTANAVLYKLSSAIAELFQKELPNNVYKTEEGEAVCVFGKNNSFQMVVEGAFSQIRNAATEKPDILEKLINIIKTLYPLARTKGQRNALKEQLEYIQDHIESLSSPQESKRLKKILDEVAAKL